MSNYNSQLQSNNTDLQEVLELLRTKAPYGGTIHKGSDVPLDNIGCDGDIYLVVME